MQSNKLIIFILSFILTSVVQAEIIPTYSIESGTVKDLLKKIDKDSLVLVNIEDTLIMPKSSMFAYQNPYRNFIETLAARSKKVSAFNDPIQNWFLQRKLVLVEPPFDEFIDSLNKTGAQVFGINEMHLKIYELIKDPEEWRYNELINLGIHFNEKFADKNLIKLTEDPSKQLLFYKGIIFTGKTSKPDALLNFLKISNLRPKKIIIFDNNLKQLKQIEYSLRKFDIDFFGVNYLAITRVQVKPNEKLIKLQQDTLISKGKWLEDEAAAEILKSGSSVHQ